MSNILIFKFPYNSAFGGGEVHTLQLFKELEMRGHDFYLVSSCNVLDEEFKKRGWKSHKTWMGFEPVSIKGIIFFCLLSPFLFIKIFYYLLKYKINHKIDKLYCLSLTEKILGTFPAKILGYDVFWMEHLRIERWLLQNPLKYLFIPLSRLAITITVSNSVKNQLIGIGLDKNKVKVIYNGVNIENFQSASKIENTEDKIIIGTACRLCVEKGVDYLISAFSRIKNDNTELWIAGLGPEKVNLQKLANRLGIENRVKFLGFVNDIPDYMNQLDIFALTPTRRESFGIAAAEASASELPVVATNISGLAEVVKDEITGFIVKSKDTNAISDALAELIENHDLRRKFGIEGRKRVKKYFTEEKMILEFENIICK